MTKHGPKKCDRPESAAERTRGAEATISVANKQLHRLHRASLAHAPRGDKHALAALTPEQTSLSVVEHDRLNADAPKPPLQPPAQLQSTARKGQHSGIGGHGLRRQNATRGGVFYLWF
jgi:hypothetical protein